MSEPAVEHPESDLDLPPFDPSTPEFGRDPYSLYRRYRARGPVHRGADGTWYLFRHADILQFLADSRLTRRPHGGARVAVPGEHEPFYATLDRMMLFRDPPDHTRLRALVQKSFTPKAVQSLRPRVEALAAALLDAVVSRGEMELIRDFAYPLPVIVLAELLGFPADERDRLRRWSGAITRGIDGSPGSPAMQAATAATEELSVRLRELIGERRRTPRSDLISLLIQAEEHGSRLTEDELVSNCIFLMVAGHETTTALIGNGMLALLNHPLQLQALVDEPQLLPDALEELVRFDSPVQFVVRTAAENIEFGGRLIKAGERLCALIGAGNRDPEAFREPERLDVRRPLRRHVAFGHGIHFCLGASLARLEGSVAFGALLRRLPDLRMGQGPVKRPPVLGMRALSALPLRFGAS